MERGQWTAPANKLDRSLLIYITRGALHCEVANDIWIAPSSSLFWLPAETEHRAYAYGQYSSLSIWVAIGAGLPKTCRIGSVSPLLRELLIKPFNLSFEPEYSERNQRLMSVIIDEIGYLSWDNLRLPIPQEPRLRALVDKLLSDRGNKEPSALLAKRIGISERTMRRLFLKDVRMSFGAWKRQLHVTIAVQRMAGGSSVQAVALELGYENASIFSTMFKSALGRPPVQYLAQRLKHNEAG